MNFFYPWKCFRQLRETWSVWLHPVVHSESLSGCIGSVVGGFGGCWDGGDSDSCGGSNCCCGGSLVICCHI